MHNRYAEDFKITFLELFRFHSPLHPSSDPEVNRTIFRRNRVKAFKAGKCGRPATPYN